VPVKILIVLYDDPVDGYPETYARDSIPKLERYPDGQTLPTPEKIDFKPGQLLGCVSGGLGLREFLEKLGHKVIITSDKDGPNSVFEKELRCRCRHFATVLARLSDRRANCEGENLKLAITAGIGSDHVTRCGRKRNHRGRSLLVQ
jgi:formate dehydrogenase